MIRDPVPASKERAAGKPAAEGTGRHHNVREDIGLAAAEPEKRPQHVQAVVCLHGEA
jgi:hypothetical protein